MWYISLLDYIIEIGRKIVLGDTSSCHRWGSILKFEFVLYKNSLLLFSNIITLNIVDGNNLDIHILGNDISKYYVKKCNFLGGAEMILPYILGYKSHFFT